ncbi:MAG: hypothetical protein AAF615_03610 [Pseudomonadota bacterium]
MHPSSADVDILRLDLQLDGLTRAAGTVGALDIIDWVRSERGGYATTVPDYRVISEAHIATGPGDTTSGHEPALGHHTLGLRHPLSAIIRAMHGARGGAAKIAGTAEDVWLESPTTLPDARFDVVVSSQRLRTLTMTVERLIVDWQAQITTRLLHEARDEVWAAHRLR